MPADPEALAEFYRFRDFAHFIEVYAQVNALVTGADDVEDLVVGLARDLAAGTVRYAEVTVTPLSHVRAGVDPAALADALTAGRERARTEHGVELAWIFDTPGELGVEAAWDTLAWVLRRRPPGTVGFGLGGPEVGVGRARFARPFTVAREAGLRSLPHAGETTGPATVWSALHDLGAERIGHGIHAITDPRLLDHLAEHRIPLEVCPTSNVRTGAVPSMAAHPLARLVQWGVIVTLNTDDPGMFGCDLLGEYRVAHERFGMTAAELAQLARNGIDASSCPPALARAMHAEIDALPLPPLPPRATAEAPADASDRSPERTRRARRPSTANDNRCRYAGGMTPPAPDAASAAAFYDHTAEYVAVLLDPAWEALGPALTAALDGLDPAAGPVVDVGAGSGLGTRVIARALPDAEILAVEPDRALRTALLAGVAADPDLRARVTVLDTGLLTAALPERIGALVAMNVLGHFDPPGRRRIWALLDDRLAAGGRAVLHLQPPYRPEGVPATPMPEVTVGRRRYRGSAAAEPAGADAVTWEMSYVVDQEGAAVTASRARNHWFVLTPEQLAAELVPHGLRLRVDDAGTGVHVARREQVFP